MAEPILIKKGTWEKEIRSEKKRFMLKIKTERLEAITTIIEPQTDLGETFTHEGEEVHMVVEGVIEFDVDGKTYILGEGDWLWHRSDVPHHARNLSDRKGKYITIGVPPTFM